MFKKLEFEIAPGRSVGGKNPVFIIADIGQNHDGSYVKAKKLIRTAADCGVDCVKFEKAHVESGFTPQILQRRNRTDYLFGCGEPKPSLELSFKDFTRLKNYAQEHRLIFAASGMDKPSVDFLGRVGVPFFKVDSADCTNIPLLKRISTYNKPIVISTGMKTEKDVTKMYREVLDLGRNFAILQSTSAYPTPTESANLNVIKTYQNVYPRAVIGYSGHEMGFTQSVAAAAIGAKIIERSITLDPNQTGSLNPQQFKDFVQAIRIVDNAMGSEKKDIESCEDPCFEKLSKTIVATRHIPKGVFLSEDDIDVKAALTNYYSPSYFYDLVGRKVKNDVRPNETLMPFHLE